MTREEAIEDIKKNIKPIVGGKSLDMAIEALEQPERKTGRWIPCSERLPELDGDYLLYRPHFWGAYNGQITVCYWNGSEWSDNYKNDSERYLPLIDCMAWMPLPEPYKEEE